jgi:hypothetical protein
MKLNPIRENMTVLELNEKGERCQVLFSYKTPVAYAKLTDCGWIRYKTNQWYSKTTSKHINEWCHEYDDVCSQEEIDNLIQ